MPKGGQCHDIDIIFDIHGGGASVSHRTRKDRLSAAGWPGEPL